MVLQAIARSLTFTAEDRKNYELATGKATRQEIEKARFQHVRNLLPLVAVTALSVPLMVKSVQLLTTVWQGGLSGFYAVDEASFAESERSAFWGALGMQAKHVSNEIVKKADGTYPNFDGIFYSPASSFLLRAVPGVILSIGAPAATAYKFNTVKQLKDDLRGIWNPTARAKEIYDKKINEATSNLVRKIMLFLVSAVLLGVGAVYAANTQAWQALGRKVV